MHRAQATPAAGPALDLKIKFLRELALSLVAELSGLGDSRAVRVEQGIDLYAEVSRFEIELIRCALQHTGGHQARAARLLGLKATTLNNKIKQYKIQIDKIQIDKAAEGAPAPADSAPRRKPARKTGARRLSGGAARQHNEDARLYG